MPKIAKILHPTDLSATSRGAFRLACEVAQEHAAELIVLYVVPLPAVLYGPPPDSYLDHMLGELRRMRPADPDVHVEYRLTEGDAAKSILKTAEATRCDLIVMGTHGRAGLSRVLTGSVAERVVREAPCPVMTVTSKVSEAYLVV